MSRTLSAKPDEGGYYAIKGFLYQFDKTLIEVLRHPQTTIRFENRQDIDYEEYVLQVKHKETQQYASSKVRKAVEKLIAFFLRDTTKKLYLYCHFKDRTPQDWTLTLAELDSIIGKNGKKRYSRSVRNQFLASFTIRFSEDFETQFKQTLALIKSSFSLPDNETAVLYHSIFRSRLLDLSLGLKPLRKVRLTDLKMFLDNAEVRVFEGAYSKYVGEEKYSRLIKKTYFTMVTPNIENFERLFLVESDSAVGLGVLVKIAARLSNKFYKKGKSPQPYIAFRSLTEDRLRELKQTLFDVGIHFFDGTHFDGDRFRLNELAGAPASSRVCTLKVVSEHQTPMLVQRVHIQEAFQFFVGDPIQLNVTGDHRRIQVKRTEQILQMIN